MKRLKNEKGAITMVTLITIIFMVSFLMTSYILTSNKVKTQKEILNETRELYKPKSTMEEIYNSYFTNDNIVPIYTVEQLLAIGSNEKFDVNGKIYTFSNTENTTYLLNEDLEFNSISLGLENDWIPLYEDESFLGNFDWNGHTIKVITLSGETIIYDGTYLVTTSGNPLSLSKCTKSNLVDYKIYGNSIQNGTPSPDTPVEVESVGDKVNLFNNELPYKDLTTMITSKEELIEGLSQGQMLFYGIYSTSIGSEIQYNRVNCSSIVVPIENNETYTMNQYRKGNIILLDENFIELQQFDSDTITNSVNAKYLFAYVSNIAHAGTEKQTWTLQDILDNLQIEKGSTATEYVPYGKYRIPVKVTGANVARVNNGDLDNIYRLIHGIPVKKGQTITYIVNYTNNSSDTNHKISPRLYSDESLNTQIETYDSINSGEDVVQTITIKSDGYFTLCFGYGYSKVEFNKIFVGFGEHGLANYEPYNERTYNIILDEPLRKIGDYYDYIDFANKQVIRNISHTVLTSDMSWSTYNDVQESVLGFYSNDLPPRASVARTTTVSNKFEITTSDIAPRAILGVNYETFYTTSSILKIAVSKTRVSDKDTFLKWLDENEVYLEFVLSTSEPQPIDLPNIQLNKGKNTITIDTQVQPSDVSITYNAKQ